MHPSDVLAALLGVTLVALVLQRAEAASAFPPEVKTYTEKEAKKFLKNLNLEWAKKTNTYYLAKWDYETDISKKTLGQELKVAFEVAKFQKQQRKEAVKYPRDKFTDRDIRRQLLMYSKLGAPGLPDDKYVAYQNAEAELGSARRCNHIFQCEHKEGLDPEAENQHRLNCWMQFRYGKNASDTYASLMDLSRQAATLDNYTDYTEYLLRNFEDKDIVGRMNVMASHLDAFYKQMTVYCRQRLRNRYGNKAAPNGLPIPAHLIDDPICRTDPVPRKPLDFPGALRAKGFTVRKLFGLPDEFFRSLNMTGVPDAVWEKSILELGVNKTMSCRAVAQDFLDNKDYRIRVCGKVSDETFFTASRLVTGIVYAMEMRQQPSIYRQTMSDAFVEGIGNMVALSLLSPNFLRYQGLLAGDDSAEMDANLLYMIARHTLIPAIRSHTLDRWRFLTLTGETQPRDYNCKWWRMRQSLEGLEQPLDRSARDFDAANPDMILNPEGTLFKTIFATALGFQMHRQLCTVVGLFDPEDPSRLPLHRCNLLNQPLVSEVLKKMMQAGASKSWKDVMEQAIGTRKIDHRALLTYFEPLEKFLEEHNARTGEVVGWAVPNRQCHLTRKQLRVMDPEQAKKGYYSCPMGENEEDEEEETTLAPTTTTTPAPSTTAPTAASTAPPDEASITPTVDTAATATATEAA